jgi:hypothetical protein
MPELTKKFYWTMRQQGRLLVGTILIGAMVALALLVRSALVKNQVAELPVTQQAERALPEDVESVLKTFSYAQVDEKEKITISGKSVVRRGRRVLGLRSNLVKTNFIQQIKGSFRSSRGTTSFAASGAEWDADASHPLLLNRDVTVTLQGGTPARVKNARIYLGRGVIEVDDGSESYPLR